MTGSARRSCLRGLVCVCGGPGKDMVGSGKNSKNETYHQQRSAMVPDRLEATGSFGWHSDLTLARMLRSRSPSRCGGGPRYRDPP